MLFAVCIFEWRSRQALPLREIFQPHNGLAIRALMTDLSTTPNLVSQQNIILKSIGVNHE